VVIGGGAEEAAKEECGGGLDGTELDGAAVVWAMESVKATDTRLLELADLRRAYEWWTGGRGDGSWRRRREDAILAAGVLERLHNLMVNSN
jgi:hypothetical protein